MQRRLRRLASLDREQRRVFFASLALVPLVQIGLRVVGFRRVARVLTTRSSGAAGVQSVPRARAAADAVSLVAGRSVIGARCLGRSLVLWFLLRRRGIDAELVLGATAPEDGRLPAHAWVEVGGEPVNDAADVRERFGSFGLRLPRLAERGTP
jgi:hypothetical protein